MFDFAKAAPTFNDHIKGQLFWHGDFLRHFLPEIASVYMEKDSIVYDFGASTGNVEVALKEKIEERNIDFIAVEKCPEMAKFYRGKRTLLISDVLEICIREFSFATSILTLCFIHPSKRTDFIEELKYKCKKGGAFLILEKMVSQSGYLGNALNRVTWRNKIDNGESIDQVINKELSLSGVQYPLSEKEVEGFKLIWAYGDFRSYIWTNEF
jgi:tRNA (cmo5U34)-methyltransferase